MSPRSHALSLNALTLVVVALAALAGACADDGATDADEAAEAVLPGKADNYLSPTSREFTMWGLGQESLDAATAPATRDEREAKVRELLQMRFKAYAHYINEYVTDKEHDDANADYGGFSALVHGSSLDFTVTAVDDAALQWAFNWQLEMGGPADVMDRLPLQTDGDGNKYFLVKLPQLDEAALRNETYPKAFDPSTYTGAVDEIQVMIRPEERSKDGWPLYLSLADDGKIDILIVIGGDYNASRNDLKSAESHFKWLKSAGFAHPAKAYTELKLDSPPFTKTIDMNGKKVAVEVTLVYGDIVPLERLPELRARIIKGFETADVVVYDGHAGLDPTYSGVVYHYNPRFAITAVELAALNLPSKYQVYWFNGCKTYGVYAESVYKNANKTFENLDVVTTVSFSWLNQQTFTTSGFLSELLSLDVAKHDPRTWSEILTRVNQRNNSNVYYGVHGIDDNPHVNPYADLTTLCHACTKKSQCPGSGNLCVALGSAGAKVCAAECTDDSGCPDGYKCADIAVGGRITGHQCLASDYSCP